MPQSCSDPPKPDDEEQISDGHQGSRDRGLHSTRREIPDEEQGVRDYSEICQRPEAMVPKHKTRHHQTSTHQTGATSQAGYEQDRNTYKR
jgi:hypothetical protein